MQFIAERMQKVMEGGTAFFGYWNESDSLVVKPEEAEIILAACIPAVVTF